MPSMSSNEDIACSERDLSRSRCYLLSLETHAFVTVINTNKRRGIWAVRWRTDERFLESPNSWFRKKKGLHGEEDWKKTGRRLKKTERRRKEAASLGISIAATSFCQSRSQCDRICSVVRQLVRLLLALISGPNGVVVPAPPTFLLFILATAFSGEKERKKETSIRTLAAALFRPQQARRSGRHACRRRINNMRNSVRKRHHREVLHMHVEDT